MTASAGSSLVGDQMIPAGPAARRLPGGVWVANTVREPRLQRRAETKRSEGLLTESSDGLEWKKKLPGEGQRFPRNSPDRDELTVLERLNIKHVPPLRTDAGRHRLRESQIGLGLQESMLREVCIRCWPFPFQ